MSDYGGYYEWGTRLLNGGGENIKVGEDANYVYITMSAPFGLKDINTIRWTTFGQWGYNYFDYNLVQDATAPVTPLQCPPCSMSTATSAGPIGHVTC